MNNKLKFPFCDNKEIKYIRKIKSPLNNKEYKYWFCKNCLLEFFILLEFDSNVYVNEIYESYKDFHILSSRYILEWTKNTINILKNKLNIKDLKNKKILEVGAGDGINYLSFKEEFNVLELNYHIVELDYKSIEICKRRELKNIYNNFFDKNFVKNLIYVGVHRFKNKILKETSKVLSDTLSLNLKNIGQFFYHFNSKVISYD